MNDLTKQPNHSTSFANFDLETLNFQNLICPFGLRHETHYPSGNKKDFRTNIGDVGFEPVNLVLVTSTEYNYKYNGFEYQDELDLNWYITKQGITMQLLGGG